MIHGVYRQETILGILQMFHHTPIVFYIYRVHAHSNVRVDRQTPHIRRGCELNNNYTQKNPYFIYICSYFSNWYKMHSSFYVEIKIIVFICSYRTYLIFQHTGFIVQIPIDTKDRLVHTNGLFRVHFLWSSTQVAKGVCLLNRQGAFVSRRFESCLLRHMVMKIDEQSIWFKHFVYVGSIPTIAFLFWNGTQGAKGAPLLREQGVTAAWVQIPLVPLIMRLW